MKNRLSNITLPSSAELEQYLNGTLDSARSHEIELLAEHNDLVAEAIEGYSAVPAFNAVPEWSSVATTVKTAATAGSKWSLLTRGWWHLNGWIAGLIMGGSMVWMFAESGEGVTKSNIHLITDQIQTDLDQRQLLMSSNGKEGQQELVNQEVYAQTQSTDVPVVRINNVVQSAVPAVDDSQKTFHSVITDDSAKIASIAPDILPSLNKTDNAGIKPSQYAAVKIIHVLSYKVADYTELRSRNWTSFANPESGVPAKFESESEMKKDDQPETKAVPYLEYLTQCISAYHSRKYALASEKLSVIQSQYPEDVNAMFYNAMSQYHLAKYDQALVNFDLSIKNTLTVFREEATFYKAKTLKALGRNEEANSLFTVIVNEKGFYARNAELELDKQ